MRSGPKEPHVARYLVRSSWVRFIPVILLVGGAFLSASDEEEISRFGQDCFVFGWGMFAGMAAYVISSVIEARETKGS
jgi:hypothetical protein